MTIETPEALRAGATLAEALRHISTQLDQIAAAQSACFQCFLERAMARKAGAPEEELPLLRPAVTILPVTAVVTPAGELVLNGGGGACTEHIQIGDGPALPGRTASGLVLPGAGA